MNNTILVPMVSMGMHTATQSTKQLPKHNNSEYAFPRRAWERG